MRKAIVVLSGGQDSTTCLFWALREFDAVAAISFDYGQRHGTELAAASEIAQLAGVSHVVASLPIGRLVASALTRDSIAVDVSGGLGGLPSTFVPGRNLVFLTVAASYAISEGARDIVTGVCQVDYSGYPDCRRTTIDAVESSVRLGNDIDDFVIHTPLMGLSKAATVQLARELGGRCWKAVGLSITCYHGHRPGCGECPSCVLRAKGFAECGVKDPANENQVI